MNSVSKKRLKAYLIDVAVSSALTAGVEYLLRKKVKNESLHNLVTPTVVMWTLEYVQLRGCGQTIGYKKKGLVLEGEEESKLTSSQIIKRMGYRDTLSTLNYLKSPKKFEGNDGSSFPHDRFSSTVVKEI
ncbi:RDD family protein [Halalkalibacillus sediminis]|uniref:RDD family protein n=1 Tax=Halalkalibacillus sediminis TaxID=2018042 RepID=A0A2I0QTA3_9BACI|nr:RDD family protein [Halalkalibacillus sediminis]PKR77572.1 RDD family protein [Halalkalibacillus sediminis]